jgi:methyl-accepting chemotaxis protein
MVLLQRMWDRLDGSIFRNRMNRTLSVFGVLAAVQSAILLVMLVYLMKISGLVQGVSTPDRILPSIEICIAIGIFGILNVVVLCLLFWNMTKYLMVKPLRRVNELFKHLATGSTDLSEDIQTLPYPELADVSKGYNAFMGNIRQIIEHLRKAGIRIAIDSTRMHRIVDVTGEKTTQQTELSDQVTVFSSEANIAIKEVAENAQFVSQNTSANLESIRR